MNYRLSEFKTLKYKVLDMIATLGEINIDVEKFNILFNEIIDDVDKKCNDANNKNCLQAYFDSIYRDGIEKLKLLEKDLLKYNVYFKAVTLTNYVNDLLTKNDNDINKKDTLVSEIFSDEQINYLVDSMIDVLSLVRDSNDIDQNNKIIKDMYNTAYQIIKLELLTKFESRIYNYVKRNQLDMLFIDKCFQDELKTIDLSDKRYNKLNLKMLKQANNGLGQDYFDLDSIKLLLVCNGDINNNIAITLKDGIDSSDKLGKKFDVNVKNLYSLKKKLDNYKINLVRAKKKIVVNSLSVLLTLTMFAGWGLGAHKLLKKIVTYDKYNKVVTTYSDLNGLNVTDECVYIDFTQKDLVDKRYIREYGLWKQIDDNEYEREIKVYDISDFNFDSIEDYISYGVDNYKVSYDLETEVSENVENYSSSYIEVEKIDVDEPSKVFRVSEYCIGIVLFLCAYTIISLLVASAKNYTFIDRISDLKDYLKGFKENKKLSVETLEEMKKIVLDMQDIINKNEELKLEFNKLYEKNKFLLNDPDELFRRFEEVSSKINFSKVDINNKDMKKLILLNDGRKK